jgi:RimJ/RimL family protein N-acetyltransferase
LQFCFYYPFVQLGCRRITGLVPSVNLAARKFDENLGFVLEATLKDAHPEGDLLVYVMHKGDCRWLSMEKEKHNGQERRTGTA